MIIAVMRCWRSGDASMPTSGDTRRLVAGGATLARCDSERLMNANAADQAAAKELALLMLLPLLFCCAGTAGVASLSCWTLMTAELLALTLCRQCCTEQRDL